jgi:glutamate racemase
MTFSAEGYQYILPLESAKLSPRTIVLATTHYPLLQALLNAMDQKVNFIFFSFGAAFGGLICF